jgi:hypothetical protein
VTAAALARALGKSNDVIDSYLTQSQELRDAIVRCFHATIDGFPTYRYYEGNTVLRAWICLPLTMGILDRARGTIAALFSPALWTADGVATQAGDKTFWDRATLYALRGVLAAGATETAIQHLVAYSRRRLLGNHVPYAVEAYPEGDQAHLSAESALYCRVITEGLFGIVPTGFSTFTCTPRLPTQWPAMALRNIRAFGQPFDLAVHREGDRLVMEVTVNGEKMFARTFTDGADENGIGCFRCRMGKAHPTAYFRSRREGRHEDEPESKAFMLHSSRLPSRSSRFRVRIGSELRRIARFVTQ